MTTTTTASRRAFLGAAAIPAVAAVAAVPALAGTAGTAATAVSIPDRRLLETYASWLFYERRLLCHELYPELGGDADSFVATNAGRGPRRRPVGVR